jgi:hypothetical protein
VARGSTRWTTAVALSALIAALVHAQVSDEHDVRRALPARHEQADSSDSTDESPTPPPGKKARAKLKKTPTPSPMPHKSPSPGSKGKKKKKKPVSEEEATPKKTKAKQTPEPESSGSRESDKVSTKKTKSAGNENGTPSKKQTSANSVGQGETPAGTRRATALPGPSETPTAQAVAPVTRAVAVPTPVGPPAPPASASNSSAEEPAQLTIEKSGSEKQQGFWYRFFHGTGASNGSGSGACYRFLTRAVRAEIDRAPADHRSPQWQFIVVHNSGTRQGNARVFDYYHRHVRHMQNGLAYHFVIGNGSSTGNGQIEVGDRWRRQINGGHVHSDYLNNIALGICLVGDFNHSQPTSAQLQSCEELVRYLRQRCGKVGNHYMLVKPHREMNPPRWATDCPGDVFPYSWFRRFQE